MVLASASALAQKPWEMRVDLPVPVPIELPAVPPTNPFAAPVATPPPPVATPLREKFADTFAVLASAYIDAQGVCRRVVFTRLPWPGVDADLRPLLTRPGLHPARACRRRGPGLAAARHRPQRADRRGTGGARAGRRAGRDRGARRRGEAGPRGRRQRRRLPATPIDRVDQLPNPKRVPDPDRRRPLAPAIPPARRDRHGRPLPTRRLPRLPGGVCAAWLLASMAEWTFRPAAGAAGPVAAWVLLDGEIEVKMGDLASDALRVMRQGSYPGAAAPSAAVPPPGA